MDSLVSKLRLVPILVCYSVLVLTLSWDLPYSRIAAIVCLPHYTVNSREQEMLPAYGSIYYMLVEWTDKWHKWRVVG